MKRFTVKDFITYNSPCFSCDNKINILIGIHQVEDPVGTVYLTPTVTTEFTEVNLKITYSSILKLKIFHKTNKFQTSSIKGLTKYLRGHKLFLDSRCSRCLTQITSGELDFNMETGYAKPVSIWLESLIVTHDNTVYQIHSSFNQEKSWVVVARLDTDNLRPPTQLELPTLPLYKFKDKEHFIEKLRTYVIFS